MLSEEYKIKDELYLIPESEFDKFLSRSVVLDEPDTYFNGKIRILLNEEKILVQEKTDHGKILIRSFSSEQEARKFVDDRLNQYEKRWDGCGCKIYFYE
ncbi:MAG: hypothetical protein Kow0098_21500 [Ignavibacteriaceae bacterium]